MSCPPHGTYVVFKGYAGLRRIYKGSRYSVDRNFAKLAILTVGEGGGKALKAGLALGRATQVGFVLVGIMDYAQWSNSENERFVSDLLIQWGSSAVQIVAGSVAAALVMAIGVGMGFVTSPFWVVVGTVLVGIAIGACLSMVDNYFGITKSAQEMGRRIDISLVEIWTEYIEKPLNSFLWRCEREIRSVNGVPF